MNIGGTARMTRAGTGEVGPRPVPCGIQIGDGPIPTQIPGGMDGQRRKRRIPIIMIGGR